MEITEYPSPNYNQRQTNQTPPDILVIHTMNMELSEALELLTSPAREISSHYVIATDGTIYRLVSEDCRAWHCGTGKSKWRGKDDLNSFSLGIELIRPVNSSGYPKEQIDALTELTRSILSRFPIPARNIVGHSDIAPGRKTDPIFPFPWKDLALKGIGLWTDDFTPAAQNAESMLEAIGYDIKDLSAAITAFQMHFLPENVNGKADDLTLKRLSALTRILDN